MTRFSKADVERYCQEHGISLSCTRPPLPYHVHVDIDAPDPKVFRAHGVHNLALWDSYTAKPEWDAVMRELLDADFGDCTDTECEYCLG